MKFNTDVLHAEQVHARLWGSYEPAAMAHVSPIYQTSTYVLEDFDTAVYLNQHVDEGFSYTRFGSPNCDELEKRLRIWSTRKPRLLWLPGWAPFPPP